MKNVKLSQKITESALMLALTTILSVIPLIELPYGGSITFASMAPMVIIAYRFGAGWGVITGAAYGLIQLLFGLKVLSYATSAAAVVAIIALDYLLAFMSTSVAGFFRGRRSQAGELVAAMAAVCALRYIFHVISGCTVWAGLSIPTADAFVYSLIYNATYMLPETVINCAAILYLGSSLDFTKLNLGVARPDGVPRKAKALSAVGGFVLLGAVAAIVAMIFGHLQNAETGEFNIRGIFDADLTAVGIIAAAAAVVVIVLALVRSSVIRNQKGSE